MRLNQTKEGTVTVFSVEDPIIDENLDALEAEMSKCSRRGESQIILDLSRVPFIDSRGLELLVSYGESLGEMGGGLCIATPSPLCHEILGLTRLTERLDIHEDKLSAIRSFL